MDQGEHKGPPVPPGEILYRFVTVSSFWVSKENRPSSSLFDDPPRVSIAYHLFCKSLNLVRGC
jgi:hypothetical protein